MNYEMLQGRWKQFQGWSLEVYGKTRSDHLLWADGLHKRIDGLLQYNKAKARLMSARARTRY